MSYIFLFTVSLSLIVLNCNGQDGSHYHVLYRHGVDAYLDEKWSDCVAYIQKSLELYFNMQSLAVQCRERCREEFLNQTFGNVTQTHGHLHHLLFYEQLVKEAFCLVKCKNKHLSGHPEPSQVPVNVEDEFHKRMPYDYIQICYFKLGDVEKAATYAYSFILHNSKNEVMMSNLKYYLSLPDIEESELKDVEAKPYQRKFGKGQQYYIKKEYKQAAKNIEYSINSYLKSENECRYLCEGPYKPQDNRPDFILAIADHFFHALKCKKSCIDRLSFFKNVAHENFFPELFNYLQFSYYKLGEFQKACENVASYITLLPDNEIMLMNKDFYIENGVCFEESLVPRQEVIKYAQRNKYENKLLEFIEKWTPNDSEDDNEIIRKRKLYTPPQQVLDWSKHEGIDVFMKDLELNGSLRFVADGFATRDQCEKLIDIAHGSIVEGDGYGVATPHTKNEKFEGLGADRVAKLVESGQLNPSDGNLYLDLSERARMYVEKYFNLKNLYFDFTHLVCRTALTDVNREKDLSHRVHSDNCVIKDDGSCLKEKPAYTWRDYSAILYLNDDFDGGNFFFSTQKYQSEADVRPRCGRIVGFAADNWHGVKSVLKGQRCCLAMWFTLDPSHDERARHFAYNSIKKVERSK